MLKVPPVLPAWVKTQSHLPVLFPCLHKAAFCLLAMFCWDNCAQSQGSWPQGRFQGSCSSPCLCCLIPQPHLDPSGVGSGVWNLPPTPTAHRSHLRECRMQGKHRRKTRDRGFRAHRKSLVCLVPCGQGGKGHPHFVRLTVNNRAKHIQSRAGHPSHCQGWEMGNLQRFFPIPHQIWAHLGLTPCRAPMLEHQLCTKPNLNVLRR